MVLSPRGITFELLNEDNGHSEIPKRKTRVWGRREQNDHEASKAPASGAKFKGLQKVNNEDKCMFMKYFEQLKLVEKLLDE